MNEEKKCPICGESTYLVYGKHPRKDGLCGKHSQMLFNDDIAQCENCGKWYERLWGCDCKIPKNNSEKSSNEIIPFWETKNTSPTNKEKKQENNNPYSKNCIICDQKTNKKYFCNDCIKGIQTIHKDIAHLENIQQAKEYYSNLKNSIFWINKIEYAQNACRKLYAIAETIDDFKYIGQQDKARQDIAYLLKKKKEYLNKEAEEKKEETIKEDEVSIEIADYRKVNPANIHCRDGHYVRSPYEKIIDDTLYSERIFHEYERKYKALDGHAYYPDFYIPDFDLYIEYFGMNENKQKNLYKKGIFEKDTLHNFAFIWSEQNGILDEIILEIIEEYKRKRQK